jgi:hypothetical protein
MATPLYELPVAQEPVIAVEKAAYRTSVMIEPAGHVTRATEPYAASSQTFVIERA